MHHPTPRPRATSGTVVAAVLAAAFAIAIAGCSDRSAAASGSALSPPEVGVVVVAPRTLPVPTELPGRIEASRVAQVRARVTGIVQRRLFVEGTDVKAGQALFLIDPAPYKAAIDSARASLAKAQANAQQAGALATRYKPLREANAISQQDFINATSAAAQAEADVAAARAAVQSAQLNLDYCNVTAPISGRIGQALVTEGALVTQAEATQLALVQQINPVYANFTQPVADINKLRQAISSGKAKALGTSVPVRIVLDDGTPLAQPGKLLFSDLSVDPTSGQVVVRAEVPNADGALLPGMYVRGRIAQSQVDGAELIPQQAVTRSAQSDTVLVVGGDGKPVTRIVRLGGSSGANWIVLSGLNAGEQVIVDGFQKISPDSAVKPVPWNGGVQAGGAGAASASASGPASPPAPASSR